MILSETQKWMQLLFSLITFALPSEDPPSTKAHLFYRLQMYKEKKYPPNIIRVFFEM